MLTFGNKLNRSYTLYMPFMNDDVEVTTLFNKSNIFMGFNIDQRLYQKKKDGEIYSYIYKNLNESVFATTFLDIRNYRSNTLDIQQQFNNILPKFRDSIQYELNETIKLSKIQTPNGDFESSLYIYVFSFLNYGNNFLYFLAERQHIDVALDKKIVRTCGLQICSKDAHEDFLKNVEYHNGKVLNHENLDESLNTLFPGKKNINVRRFS